MDSQEFVYKGVINNVAITDGSKTKFVNIDVDKIEIV